MKNRAISTYQVYITVKDIYKYPGSSEGSLLLSSTINVDESPSSSVLHIHRHSVQLSPMIVESTHTHIIDVHLYVLIYDMYARIYQFHTSEMSHNSPEVGGE